VDFRERIRISGEMIPQVTVMQFVADHRAFLDELRPSFFEMTVAMAFDYFARNQVDVAVIEVGMGGRLDSTNIITPLASVITNISFDHTQFLGETLPALSFIGCAFVIGTLLWYHIRSAKHA
jgi:dihydrofolate synthase/folylpolyglutamate synthase